MTPEPEIRRDSPTASWRTAGIVAALVMMAVLFEGGPAPRGALAGSDASIEVYRGLGTWIDIYDDAAWADPAGAVAAMKARGVRTLYLETSNFSRKAAFVFPDGVRAFVDAARAQGLAIVAWYLPGFLHVARDLKLSIAAVDYRTPSGNGFDSFALDIESPAVKNPALRIRRLLDLSSRLRGASGSGYPLGAIIPSPLAMKQNHDYWPNFPYRELAQTYDVFLPMTYFTWRVSGELAAHSYTAANIDIIRQEIGDSSVPIHVIGGIAGDATPSETAGFVHAVRERGVIGASYYTFPATTGGEWRMLSRIPVD